MGRYGLRDDQWERIKDFCLGVTGMSAEPLRTIACSWRQ